MKIVHMDELATSDIDGFSTDGTVRALSLFRDLFLPFFVVNGGSLTWKDELALAGEYRKFSGPEGCFVWRPGFSPLRVKGPQELIAALRQADGYMIVQQAAQVRITGTVETLPGGVFRVEMREGLPGESGRTDTITVESGEVFGGGEDIITDDELSLIRSRFSPMPEDLVIHWALNDGVHALWADRIERPAEAEAENSEAEEPPAAPTTVKATVVEQPSKVRFTAAEIYAEFEGGDMPPQADGLIVPIESFSALYQPPDVPVFLRLDREEEGGEALNRLKDMGYTGLILPPACGSEEVEYILRSMEEEGLRRRNGLRVLVTVRHPCTLLIAEDILRVSDGLFVDTAAFAGEIFGGRPVSSVVRGAEVAALRKAVSLLQRAADGAEREKIVIYSIPAGMESDMAALLIPQGARAVSTVPERMNTVIDAVAREEHRLLLREVGLRK